MTHYVLEMPVSEEQVRALKINDTVTLETTLFGIRDATLIHMFDRKRTTRFDLRGHAVIHTAPNVKKVEKSAEYPAGYAPVCIGTTTSDRMERFTGDDEQQRIMSDIVHGQEEIQGIDGRLRYLEKLVTGP